MIIQIKTLLEHKEIYTTKDLQKSDTNVQGDDTSSNEEI